MKQVKIFLCFLTAVFFPVWLYAVAGEYVDATSRIAALVKDNQLTLSGPQTLSDYDPAPGIVKKLRIDYRIGAETKTKVIYEGQKMNIAAPSGSKLEIVQAVYGDFPSRLVDVTEQIKDAASGGRLKLKIDNARLVGNADPAPATVKELRVYYTVDGRLHSCRGKQDTDVSLPTSSDGAGKLEITSAFYGDPATTVSDYIKPLFLAIAAPPPPDTSFVPVADPVYQWSVRVGEDPYRRAYLWVPDNCKRVRGVVIGVQNMVEQQFFADPKIRQAATDENLALVWISPGSDMKTLITKYPNKMHKFNPPQEACDEIRQVLASIAEESGYTEIEFAPLIAVGHSGASPFAWGMQYNFDAGRMAAAFPFKSSFPGHVRPGIPIFHISSEYREIGASNWGECYQKDRGEMLRLRREGDDRLLSEFVDIGSGHYDWNPASAAVVAKFLRKVSQYRIPAEAPLDGPVALNAIDPRSGVLIAADRLGTPEGVPVPVSKYNGDIKNAFWYFDEDMAKTVNDYMVAGLTKAPQVVTIYNKGRPVVDYSKGGNPSFSTDMLSDGVTFRMKGAFLSHSPSENLYKGQMVGHAEGPVLFSVGSGALRQTGPDTFRFWMSRGGLINMGQPWEPWIIACHPGDGQFRRAVRPVHPFSGGSVNRDGKPQIIEFPVIPDQQVGVEELQLQATSDSGLPVQFYVVSGPVQIDPNDNTRLKFTAIPPRARFPVKVVIGAYQWGRPKGDKVQNAAPAFREFLINNIE